jgi:putative mRNA 3-end processing factor
MREIEVAVDRGVHIRARGKYVLIDPTGFPSNKPDVVLISHAHEDHYSLRVLRTLHRVPLVMSRATRLLIDSRDRLENVLTVEPGQEVEVAGLRITAHEAGHIIGSLQFSFDLGDALVVYTGDFNLDRRLILRPAEVVKGDLLIIDATYGSPRYIFPPRAELYKAIVSRINQAVESGRSVVAKGRKLGVAQELTALVSMATHLVPLVESSVARYNELYELLGEPLGRYVLWYGGGALTSSAVVISRLGARYAGFSETIVCTGWALGRGFPLSSHADFAQLVRYVLDSKALLVVPFTGFRHEFSSFLRESYGIDAHSENIVKIAL